MDIAMTIPAKAKAGAGKTAAKAARKEGLVPAVIYGGAADPEMVAIDPRPIWKGLNERGFFAKVMALDVDGKQMNVLPRDVQFDRVTDQPIHIDFMRVDPETIVKVRVPVDFVNEADSPGLKRGAVLNVVRHSVEVRCKAGEIPTKFDADLAGLQINDAVKYSMVQVSGNVTPTIVGRDFVIATVTAPSALKRQMMDQATAAAGGDGEAEGGEAEE